MRVSETLLPYLKNFELEELKILRDTNARLAKQYRENAERMDEIVSVMNDEIDRRTYGSVLCPKCRHRWTEHEQEILLADRTVYECMVHAGMGTWCACEERKPNVLDS